MHSSKISANSRVGNLDDLRSRWTHEDFLGNFSVESCRFYGVRPLELTLVKKMRTAQDKINEHKQQIETSMFKEFINGLSEEEIKDWLRVMRECAIEQESRRAVALVKDLSYEELDEFRKYMEQLEIRRNNKEK